MATGNTPSAVVSVLATDIVSQVDMRPDIAMELARRHGDQQLGVMELLQSMGYKRPATRTQYDHFEDDFIIDNIKTGAAVTASSGAGTVYEFKLSTDSIDSNQAFPVQIGDIGVTPVGDINFIVENIEVNGTDDVDVTIAPLKAADDLLSATNIPSGTTLMLFTNGYAEGTGQPSGMYNPTIFESGYLQIIKEAHEVTGTQMNQATWWTKYDDGTGLKGWHAKDLLNTEYRFRLKMNMALMFGDTVDNPVVLTSSRLNPEGREFKTTEGILNMTRRCGNTLSHTPGSWSVAQFNELERIQEAEMHTGALLHLQGLNLAMENQDVLKDYFADQNIIEARNYGKDEYFNGNEGLMVAVGINCLAKNGRYHYFMKMPAFSHPKLGGSAGYAFQDRGLVLPLGMTTVQDRDGNRQSISAIGMRYSEFHHNRMVQTWYDGAAGADPSKFVGELDKQVINMRSNIGFEGVGMNRAIIIE